MVFDLSAQMKMAQSLTELTLKNMSAATEATNQTTNSTAPTATGFSNPFAEMMDPNNWSKMMTPGASSTSKPSLSTMWWPLDQSFLNAAQPNKLDMQGLGLPNMAIPLGLNPFGDARDKTKFSLPILSSRSPLAGSGANQLPNMFWWLVRNEDETEQSAAEADKTTLAPWALLMDPFGLLKDTAPEPEEIESNSQTQDLMEMMFDPFGLFKDNTVKAKSKKRHTKSTRSAKSAQPETAIDYFDPFSLMKSATGNTPTSASDDNSRNMFFGFQPGAKHPLMNSGQPTGMYYLAIALPKDIQNINPHLPPWNLAF